MACSSQNFCDGDYVNEMTVQKSRKYDNYKSFEHLLFLVSQSYFSRSSDKSRKYMKLISSWYFTPGQLTQVPSQQGSEEKWQWNKHKQTNRQTNKLLTYHDICFSSFSAFPARSLGFTIFREIFCVSDPFFLIQP